MARVITDMELWVSVRIGVHSVPLHVAIQHSQWDVARILLTRAPLGMVQDSDGRTAWDLPNSPISCGAEIADDPSPVFDIAAASHLQLDRSSQTG